MIDERFIVCHGTGRAVLTAYFPYSCCFSPEGVASAPARGEFSEVDLWYGTASRNSLHKSRVLIHPSPAYISINLNPIAGRHPLCKNFTCKMHHNMIVCIWVWGYLLACTFFVFDWWDRDRETGESIWSSHPIEIGSRDGELHWFNSTSSTTNN